YDRYGREVLVDIYTGEVIGVRESRGSFRDRDAQRSRERQDERARQDRYYLDDPDDMARLRRQQRIEELGRNGDPYPADRLPNYRDYRALPEPGYDGGYEDEFAREEPWRDERGYEP